MVTYIVLAFSGFWSIWDLELDGCQELHGCHFWLPCSSTATEHNQGRYSPMTPLIVRPRSLASTIMVAAFGDVIILFEYIGGLLLSFSVMCNFWLG